MAVAEATVVDKFLDKIGGYSTKEAEEPTVSELQSNVNKIEKDIEEIITDVDGIKGNIDGIARDVGGLTEKVNSNVVSPLGEVGVGADENRSGGTKAKLWNGADSHIVAPDADWGEWESESVGGSSVNASTSNKASTGPKISERDLYAFL